MTLNRVLLLAGLTLSISTVRLMGQSTFGAIVGVVTDSSSAVVPETAIEVTNTDENVTRSVLSNTLGGYQALNLKPGNYKIVAKKAGFSTVELSGVVLDARQERRADITLSVASVNQTVQVTAAASVVNTENGTISDTKGFQEVTELPVNYRGATTSPLGALVTVPSVQRTATADYRSAAAIPR